MNGYHSGGEEWTALIQQTGVIFGNITYDEKTSDASANIVLSDIHLDIMDYIKPNYVNEATFRSSWTGQCLVFRYLMPIPPGGGVTTGLVYRV